MLILRFLKHIIKLPPRKTVHLTVTSSVCEHNPQWWAGWNRKRIGLGRSGKLFGVQRCRRGRKRALGEMGRGVGERGGLFHHGMESCGQLCIRSPCGNSVYWGRRHEESKGLCEQQAGWGCWRMLRTQSAGAELSWQPRMKASQPAPACSSAAFLMAHVQLRVCPWTQLSLGLSSFAPVWISNTKNVPISSYKCVRILLLFPDQIFLHRAGPCQNINFRSSYYAMSTF